jgi:hypothetical protein
VTDDNVFDGDVFDGDVQHRLRRVGRRVRDASLDAQMRDWLAERPDPRGFSRLGQAHWEITAAADRYGRALPADWVVQLGGGVAGVLTTLVILLAGGASSLPVLVGAIVAGPFAAQLVISATAAVQKWWASRDVSGPAAIDDPYLYADLSRRLEACAAAARADRSDQHRAAAADIVRALDWLSLAQRNRLG